MAEHPAQAATSVDDSHPLWLAQASGVLDVLAQSRSVALVDVEPGERVAGLAVLEELGRVLRTAPVSVTEIGLLGAPALGWQDLLERLEGFPLLFDLEALCWEPWLDLDLRRFLELHARRSGVVALWPGRVICRVARFSAPGRNDHVRVDLAGWSILRPVQTRFPSEPRSPTSAARSRTTRSSPSPASAAASSRAGATPPPSAKRSARPSPPSAASKSSPAEARPPSLANPPSPSHRSPPPG